MKKFLNILFISFILASLLASVSENLKLKAQSLTNMDQYSSSLVRLPNKEDLSDNLASTKGNSKEISQNEQEHLNY